MVFAQFCVTLDLNVYTCECHGPSLDLYMVAVLYSRLIYGISYRIRVVHFAENNSGTVRIHAEIHTLYICREVSSLELVVVNRDTNCILFWHNLYMVFCTLFVTSRL